MRQSLFLPLLFLLVFLLVENEALVAKNKGRGGDGKRDGYMTRSKWAKKTKGNAFKPKWDSSDEQSEEEGDDDISWQDVLDDSDDKPTPYVAVSAPAPAAPNCTILCDESAGEPGYVVGNTYVYNWNGKQYVTVNTTTEEVNEITLNANIFIDVLSPCKRQLRVSQVVGITTDVSSSYHLSNSFSDPFKTNSIQYASVGGRVTAVCASANELPYVLNIKRAMLSALQLNAVVFSNRRLENVDEESIHGRCRPQYTLVEGSAEGDATVTKITDGSTCTDHAYRVNIMRGSRYATPSYLSTDELPLLNSTETCTLTTSQGRVTQVSCFEQHLFRPFSNDLGKGAVVTGTLSITSNGTTTTPSGINALTGARPTTLKYEAQETSAVVSRNPLLDAQDLVNQECIDRKNNGIQPDSPDKLLQLVAIMKLMDKNSLLQLLTQDRECYFNFSKSNSLADDALGHVRSDASVELIVEQLSNASLTLWLPTKALWLTSLFLLKAPTPKMIDSLTKLVTTTDDYKPNTTSILVASTVAHEFCESEKAAGRNCLDSSELQTLMSLIAMPIAMQCGSMGQEHLPSMVTALRALGNIGYLDQPTLENLKLCAIGTEKDMLVDHKTPTAVIRASALEAFRRLDCDVDRSILRQVLNDSNYDAELRIHAYLGIMKCPTEKQLRFVRAVLEQEKTQQLGSFLYSHLANLAETNDPLLQETRALVERSDLLQSGKRFADLSFTRYSRNFEQTVSLADTNLGGRLDGNVIFSHTSGFPRSLSANVSFNWFGRQVNLLEVGLRLQNIGQYMSAIFDHGMSNDNGGTVIKENTSQISLPFGNRFAQRFAGQDPDAKTIYRTRRQARGGKSNVDKNRIKNIDNTKKNSRKVWSDEAPSAYLSARMFGNEFAYTDLLDAIHNVASNIEKEIRPEAGAPQAKSIIEYLVGKVLPVFLAQNNELTLGRDMRVLDTTVAIGTTLGLPLKLAADASLSAQLQLGSGFELGEEKSKLTNNDVGNRILKFTFNPSGSLQVNGRMGVELGDGAANIGLRFKGTLHSKTDWSLRVKILESNDKEEQQYNLEVGVPTEKQELISFRTNLYMEKDFTSKEIEQSASPMVEEYTSELCAPKFFAATFGLKHCLTIKYTNATGCPHSPKFPMNGPTQFSIYAEQMKSISALGIVFGRVTSDKQTKKHLRFYSDGSDGGAFEATYEWSDSSSEDIVIQRVLTLSTPWASRVLKFSSTSTADGNNLQFELNVEDENAEQLWMGKFDQMIMDTTRTSILTWKPILIKDDVDEGAENTIIVVKTVNQNSGRTMLEYSLDITIKNLLEGFKISAAGTVNSRAIEQSFNASVKADVPEFSRQASGTVSVTISPEGVWDWSTFNGGSLLVTLPNSDLNALGYGSWGSGSQQRTLLFTLLMNEQGSSTQKRRLVGLGFESTPQGASGPDVSIWAKTQAVIQSLPEIDIVHNFTVGTGATARTWSASVLRSLAAASGSVEKTYRLDIEFRNPDDTVKPTLKVNVIGNWTNQVGHFAFIQRNSNNPSGLPWEAKFWNSIQNEPILSGSTGISLTKGTQRFKVAHSFKREPRDIELAAAGQPKPASDSKLEWDAYAQQYKSKFSIELPLETSRLYNFTTQLRFGPRTTSNFVHIITGVNVTKGTNAPERLYAFRFMAQPGLWHNGLHVEAWRKPTGQVTMGLEDSLSYPTTATAAEGVYVVHYERAIPTRELLNEDKNVREGALGLGVTLLWTHHNLLHFHSFRRWQIVKEAGPQAKTSGAYSFSQSLSHRYEGSSGVAWNLTQVSNSYSYYRPYSEGDYLLTMSCGHRPGANYSDSPKLGEVLSGKPMGYTVNAKLGIKISMNEHIHSATARLACDPKATGSPFVFDIQSQHLISYKGTFRASTNLTYLDTRDEIFQLDHAVIQVARVQGRAYELMPSYTGQPMWTGNIRAQRTKANSEEQQYTATSRVTWFALPNLLLTEGTITATTSELSIFKGNDQTDVTMKTTFTGDVQSIVGYDSLVWDYSHSSNPGTSFTMNSKLTDNTGTELSKTDYSYMVEANNTAIISLTKYLKQSIFRDGITDIQTKFGLTFPRNIRSMKLDDFLNSRMLYSGELQYTGTTYGEPHIEKVGLTLSRSSNYTRRQPNGSGKNSFNGKWSLTAYMESGYTGKKDFFTGNVTLNASEGKGILFKIDTNSLFNSTFNLTIANYSSPAVLLPFMSKQIIITNEILMGQPNAISRLSSTIFIDKSGFLETSSIKGPDGFFLDASSECVFRVEVEKDDPGIRTYRIGSNYVMKTSASSLNIVSRKMFITSVNTSVLRSLTTPSGAVDAAIQAGRFANALRQFELSVFLLLPEKYGLDIRYQNTISSAKSKGMGFVFFYRMPSFFVPNTERRVSIGLQYPPPTLQLGWGNLTIINLAGSMTCDGGKIEYNDGTMCRLTGVFEVPVLAPQFKLETTADVEFFTWADGPSVLTPLIGSDRNKVPQFKMTRSLTVQPLFQDAQFSLLFYPSNSDNQLFAFTVTEGANSIIDISFEKLEGSDPDASDYTHKLMLKSNITLNGQTLSSGQATAKTKGFAKIKATSEGSSNYLPDGFKQMKIEHNHAFSVDPFSASVNNVLTVGGQIKRKTNFNSSYDSTSGKFSFKGEFLQPEISGSEFSATYSVQTKGITRTTNLEITSAGNTQIKTDFTMDTSAGQFTYNIEAPIFSLAKTSLSATQSGNTYSASLTQGGTSIGTATLTYPTSSGTTDFDFSGTFSVTSSIGVCSSPTYSLRATRLTDGSLGFPTYYKFSLRASCSDGTPLDVEILTGFSNFFNHGINITSALSMDSISYGHVALTLKSTSPQRSWWDFTRQVLITIKDKDGTLLHNISQVIGFAWTDNERRIEIRNQLPSNLPEQIPKKVEFFWRRAWTDTSAKFQNLINYGNWIVAQADFLLDKDASQKYTLLHSLHLQTQIPTELSWAAYIPDWAKGRNDTLTSKIQGELLDHTGTITTTITELTKDTVVTWTYKRDEGSFPTISGSLSSQLTSEAVTLTVDGSATDVNVELTVPDYPPISNSLGRFPKKVTMGFAGSTKKITLDLTYWIDSEATDNFKMGTDLVRLRTFFTEDSPAPITFTISLPQEAANFGSTIDAKLESTAFDDDIQPPASIASQVTKRKYLLTISVDANKFELKQSLAWYIPSMQLLKQVKTTSEFWTWLTQERLRKQLFIRSGTMFSSSNTNPYEFIILSVRNQYQETPANETRPLRDAVITFTLQGNSADLAVLNLTAESRPATATRTCVLAGSAKLFITNLFTGYLNARRECKREQGKVNYFSIDGGVNAINANLGWNTTTSADEDSYDLLAFWAEYNNPMVPFPVSSGRNFILRHTRESIVVGNQYTRTRKVILDLNTNQPDRRWEFNSTRTLSRDWKSPRTLDIEFISPIRTYKYKHVGNMYQTEDKRKQFRVPAQSGYAQISWQTKLPQPDSTERVIKATLLQQVRDDQGKWRADIKIESDNFLNVPLLLNLTRKGSSARKGETRSLITYGTGADELLDLRVDYDLLAWKRKLTGRIALINKPTDTNVDLKYFRERSEGGFKLSTSMEVVSKNSAQNRYYRFQAIGTAGQFNLKVDFPNNTISYNWELSRGSDIPSMQSTLRINDHFSSAYLKLDPNRKVLSGEIFIDPKRMDGQTGRIWLDALSVSGTEFQLALRAKVPQELEMPLVTARIVRNSSEAGTEYWTTINWKKENFATVFNRFDDLAPRTPNVPAGSSDRRRWSNWAGDTCIYLVEHLSNRASLVIRESSKNLKMQEIVAELVQIPSSITWYTGFITTVMASDEFYMNTTLTYAGKTLSGILYVTVYGVFAVYEVIINVIVVPLANLCQYLAEFLVGAWNTTMSLMRERIRPPMNFAAVREFITSFRANMTKAFFDTVSQLGYRRLDLLLNDLSLPPALQSAILAVRYRAGNFSQRYISPPIGVIYNATKNFTLSNWKALKNLRFTPAFLIRNARWTAVDISAGLNEWGSGLPVPIRLLASRENADTWFDQQRDFLFDDGELDNIDQFFIDRQQKIAFIIRNFGILRRIKDMSTMGNWTTFNFTQLGDPNAIREQLSKVANGTFDLNNGTVSFKLAVPWTMPSFQRLPIFQVVSSGMMVSRVIRKVREIRKGLTGDSVVTLADKYRPMLRKLLLRGRARDMPDPTIRSMGSVWTGNNYALVGGNRHFYTFDRALYDFIGTHACAYTLVRYNHNTRSNAESTLDFLITIDYEAPNTYDVNQVWNTKRAISIRLTNWDQDVITVYSNLSVALDGQPAKLPIAFDSPSVRIVRRGSVLQASLLNGAFLITCYAPHDVCVFEASRHMHGRLSGLLGNMNSEPYDDLQTPNGTETNDDAAFGNSWAADSTCQIQPNRLSSNRTWRGNSTRGGGRFEGGRRKGRSDNRTNLCTEALESSRSTLSYCFNSVDVSPYKSMCARDLANEGSYDMETVRRVSCRVIALYFHECKLRASKSVTMPPACIRCETSYGSFELNKEVAVYPQGMTPSMGGLPKNSVALPSNATTAEIVLMYEEDSPPCMMDRSANLNYLRITSFVNELDLKLKSKGIANVHYSLVGYGSKQMVSNHLEPHVHTTAGGANFGDISEIRDVLTTLDPTSRKERSQSVTSITGQEPTGVDDTAYRAIVSSISLFEKPGSIRHIIHFKCSDCSISDADFETLRGQLKQAQIGYHVATKFNANANSDQNVQVAAPGGFDFNITTSEGNLETEAGTGAIVAKESYWVRYLMDPTADSNAQFNDRCATLVMRTKGIIFNMNKFDAVQSTCDACTPGANALANRVHLNTMCQVCRCTSDDAQNSSGARMSCERCGVSPTDSIYEAKME